MRCAYCSSQRVLSSNSNSLLTDEKVDQVLEYIKENQNGVEDTLVFFGGEPLLEHHLIEDIMNKSKNLKLKYMLYSNGLLINKVPLALLNSLDAIFISLDGDKTAHDKYRGLGTYDKIIDNLKYLKANDVSFTIGRITVEEETNLYESVTNILPHVNSVFWQIVNKPNFTNPTKFIKNYKDELNILFKYWLDNFSKGNLINIIPFLAVVDYLAFNNRRSHSFRCGAGSNFQAIDIDGKIYWCDEYVGDPAGVIGNIKNHKNNNHYICHRDIFENCKTCDLGDICLGRCRKCLTDYKAEHVAMYCELTKHLINLIKDNLTEVNQIITNYNYNSNTFYNITHCTEEIP
jgi:putative peptide-modifying radical SAM enzyme